jgi:hypothetical protein
MSNTQGRPRIATMGASRTLNAQLRQLRAAATLVPPPRASPDLDELPAPVRRYLLRALPRDQEIREVHIRQTGQLRTDSSATRWMSFEAEHTVVPPATGYLWNARVKVAPLLHLHVRDALVNGQATGRIGLLSVFTLASDENTPALHSGSLHRYLAEAVWYPSALLPHAALQWTPIDETRALATLADGDIFVSLEFRFAESGEVTGVYTPGRWEKVAAGYRQRPWEGHFWRYAERAGILVPLEADVGWYVEGQWRAVWAARLTAMRFRIARRAPRKAVP